MLVLVDGVRLNDAQSGHHNGDIPVPLDAVERIEILHGPGSSIFGADAFGGTVNVITRKAVQPASAVVETGSFGLVAGRGQVGVEREAVREVLAAAVDRSSGFMVERGFVTAGVSSQTSIGERTGLLASYLWKDFGANGFYGQCAVARMDEPDAAGRRPSTWHSRPVGSSGATGSYRTHGDHFLFDVRRPGVSENRHRTHACSAALRGSRAVGSRGSVDDRGRRGRRLGALHQPWRSRHAAHERVRRVAVRAGGEHAARRRCARRSLHRVRHRVESVARSGLVAV